MQLTSEIKFISPQWMVIILNPVLLRLLIPQKTFTYSMFQIQIKTGNISFFSLPAPGSTTPVVRRRNVGKIDYEKGRITLNPINIISGKTKDGQQILEISGVPSSNDVIGLQDLYLQLDRSNVEMIIDEISSGLDPAGSNYKVSSSYNNGSIVR